MAAHPSFLRPSKRNSPELNRSEDQSLTVTLGKGALTDTGYSSLTPREVEARGAGSNLESSL